MAWVSAPPGAGKTTLAASYGERFAKRTLWYQVDAGDRDPATFFHFVRLLAARSAPARARRLPVVPADSGVDVGVFARSFFRVFFGLLPAGATWVIDNFQEAEEASFALILREAFDQIPEGITVIVLSLVDPPPALARLVANRVIHVIDADELRFTREESDDVVLSKLIVDPAMLGEIHERTLGWAAGLVLVIEQLRRAGKRAGPLADESQAAVFDYFAEEILVGCTADEQRTLMLTASLPRVTTRLAEAMTGRPGAGPLLERMHRRHLFLDRRSGGEPSYQYHRLLKTFLEARAREALSEREREGAAERAAALLEHDGCAEEAIAVSLSASNWGTAARLIVQHAGRFYDEGRWRSLNGWIASLPASWAERDPWLEYWAGATQVLSDPTSARRKLEQAFHRFAERADTTGQILAAGVMTRACILDVDWTLLDPWIEALESLLRVEGTRADVLLSGFSRLLYVATARQLQRRQLLEWAADRVQELLAAAAHPNEAVLAGYSLVFHFAYTGQRSKGEEVVRRIVPISEDPRLGAVSRVYWLFAYGNHVLRFGAPADAIALMDEALAMASSHGLAIGRVIRRHRIAHLLMLGRLDEADDELRHLATAPNLEPYFELRAWLAWQRGQPGRAVIDAREALQQASARGRSAYRIVDLAVLAAVSAGAGDPDEARDALLRYREETSQMPGEFARFQALLIEAYIEWSCGERERCRVALFGALRIGSEQRYRSFWGWTPAMMIPLLSEALEQEIEVMYCGELIRMHRLAPASFDAERWPWPVRIRTLGRFEVALEGMPLRFEGKAQRKPLQMLKMLIAAGERPIPIAQLIDQLWPDPEDGGRKAFDVTVHRLRKLLGLDAAVVLSDRHATLDPRFVWVDAWVIDKILLPLLPSIGPAAPGAELEAAATRIFELLGGSLLAGEPDAPWLSAARTRLDQRVKRFFEQLGAHWEASGQWSRAEQAYQRALEFDPLAESFYRLQMMCLQAQGRRAEAVEVFRRCRHLLSTSLGIAPARETERVYRELVAS